MPKDSSLYGLLKNTALKEAIGTVLDLASENMLDPKDCKKEPLKSVAKVQQKDIDLVNDLYSLL